VLQGILAGSQTILHPNHCPNSRELHFAAVSGLESFLVSLLDPLLLVLVYYAIIIRVRVLFGNFGLPLYVIVNFKAVSVCIGPFGSRLVVRILFVRM
jgi:hypothetical protein